MLPQLVSFEFGLLVNHLPPSEAFAPRDVAVLRLELLHEFKNVF